MVAGDMAELRSIILVDRVEQLLHVHCDSVVKMDSRSITETWRAWNEAYQRPRKQPHAILEDTIIYRLGAVPRSLQGKHAVSTYQRQSPQEVFVLMIDSLVGWQCLCRTMPPLDVFDANLLVTANDLSWTYGSSEFWRRTGLYGDSVFLELGDL